MAVGDPSSLITALLQKTSLDDHEEVLRTCNAALKKSKSDGSAKHVKAVALLKLDRYDEALHLFESSGKELQEKAPLEYAYTLYKNGKPQAAVKITAALEHQRGSRHLEAQALYRTEDFVTAREIYESLSSTEPSLEASDLRINRGAVDAQLIWSRRGAFAGSHKPTRTDLESFELSYNAACSGIARGELRQAEVLLKRCKELCKHSDDLSDEEKTAELLPILVQHLYVLERLERQEDARDIAAELSVDEIVDVATKDIARLNVHLALPPSSNPFITHRSLGSSPTYTASDQPFQFQQRPLSWNKRVIDIHATKYDGVARSTAKLLKSSPLPNTSSEFSLAGVLHAAACTRGEGGTSALKPLLAQLETTPFDFGLLLIIVQIYIGARNPTSAVRLVESTFSRIEKSAFETKQDLRFSPGLIALVVTLYRLQGRKSRVNQELEIAAAHWLQKPNPPTSLLLSAGCALLESSNPNHTSSACNIFKRLHDDSPTDRMTTIGYVAAYARQETSMVESELQQLTPVQRLIQGVDTGRLEAAGIPQSSNALAAAQKKNTAVTATATTSLRKRSAPDQAAPNKRKRIRKSRLPKDYDPDKVPDPERWLPLRDRSTYRPRKGKKGASGGGSGKKKEADRTQGGIVVAGSSNEAMAKGKDTLSRGDENSGVPPPTTTTAAGGGGGKRKNKKGKR